MIHEVRMLCACTEEPCRTERYVSDVRIAWDELQRINDQMSAVLRDGWWHTARRVEEKAG